MRNRISSWLLFAASACGFMLLAVAAEGGTPPSGASSGSGSSPAAPSTPASSAAGQGSGSGIDPTQAKQYWGMLNDYCSKCHNTEDWAGGVAFGVMDPKDIPQDAKVWETAIDKLSGRLMP